MQIYHLTIISLNWFDEWFGPVLVSSLIIELHWSSCFIKTKNTKNLNNLIYWIFKYLAIIIFTKIYEILKPFWYLYTSNTNFLHLSMVCLYLLLLIHSYACQTWYNKKRKIMQNRIFKELKELLKAFIIYYAMRLIK